MARRILEAVARAGGWRWAIALSIGCVPSPSDGPGKSMPSPHAGRHTEPVAAPATNHENATPAYTLPTNYDDGVRRVRELREILRVGWQEDDHDKVHEPLHELAPLLRELPKLLDKQDWTDDDRAEAQRAIHELFRMFGQIDAKLHSGFGASYEDVADVIDVEIDKLQPKQGPRSP